MKIGIIGCGNMATALMTKIAANSTDYEFHTYSPSGVSAKKLASSIGGTQAPKLKDLLSCDLFLIACKPQQVSDLAKDCDGMLDGKKIISILAGTSIAELEALFRPSEVFRIMPNTPSSLGHGISLLTSSDKGSELTNQTITKMFGFCGDVIELENEKQLDELTVFSGSGPAYVFLIAKMYHNELISLGYDNELAKKLVDQLFVGSSMLMQKSTLSYQEQINKVTSKGGVTIEAVKVLNDSQVSLTINKSINAALKRTMELRDRSGL